MTELSCLLETGEHFLLVLYFLELLNWQQVLILSCIQRDHYVSPCLRELPGALPVFPNYYD